jgi:hypothetical protein
MEDETRLRQQMELGFRAKELRENELLVSIFEGLRAQKQKEWAQSNRVDADGRERIYHELNGLISIWEQIALIVQNGETAQKFLASKTQ